MNWLHTLCDGCGLQGLRVLVPENSDGSVAGKSFPSLCASCHQSDPTRKKLEEKSVDEERRYYAT